MIIMKSTRVFLNMIDGIHKITASNTLDLHHFKPKEVKALIEEFIWSCKQSGIKQGVIIHGKGTGNLRELTHSVLKKSQDILDFQLGSSGNHENWGQTSFSLR